MAEKLPDPPDYNLAAAIAGDVLLCLFIVCLFVTVFVAITTLRNKKLSYCKQIAR